MSSTQAFTLTDLEDLPGWAHLVAIPESEVDDLAAEIQSQNGRTARIARGQRCPTKERFLQELAAALQFPHYFGDNWDALEECLGDLDWLDTSHLTLIITNTDKLLTHHEPDLGVFLTILQSVHELEESPLERVLFHCDEGKVAATRKRLHAILGEKGQ